MEFIIWATVSSQSYFYWLYRASPSLAAKNIINLILVLTIWWCPCVEYSIMLLKRVFAKTSSFSWQNSVSICPAPFCTPRPNLPVIPGISWLPTFAFQFPRMKRTSFLDVRICNNLWEFCELEFCENFGVLTEDEHTSFSTILHYAPDDPRACYTEWSKSEREKYHIWTCTYGT